MFAATTLDASSMLVFIVLILAAIALVIWIVRH